MEEWKDIEKTSGRYQISSEGQLRKRVNDSYIIIKPHIDTYGYQYVDIKFDGEKKAKHIAIHRLVAIAFINNPYNLPIVHHIDENKLNNKSTNLFWCTHAQNHSFSLSANNGIIKKHRVIEQYTLDGQYIATWSSYAEAYRAVKPNNNCRDSSLISKCCRGANGKKIAYGYVWRFGKGDPMYKSEDTNIEIRELFYKAVAISPNKVKEVLSSIIEENGTAQE